MGLIDAYVRRLAEEARAAGLDADRLAAEVGDHLAEAADQHRHEGCHPRDSERRAIEHFGEAGPIVRALASSVEGGQMDIRARRVATGVGLTATVGLTLLHVLPSHELSTWTRALAGALIAVIAISAVALAWSSWRRATAPRPEPRPVLAASLLALCLGLGVLVAWGSSQTDIAFSAPHLLGRLYVGSIVVLALLFVLLARLARISPAAGPGIILAGVLGVVLNGLPSVWQPLAGIGAGPATTGVTLILVGWVVATATLALGTEGERARAWVGAGLIRLGGRLAQGRGQMSRAAQPN